MRHAAVVATPYVAFSEMFLNPQNLRFVGTRQCRSLFESLFYRNLSGNCKISFPALSCMLYSKEIEKSFIGSVPMEILGLICARNCLVFSTHSSHLEEVCFNTEVAKDDRIRFRYDRRKCLNRLSFWSLFELAGLLSSQAMFSPIFLGI